MAKRKFVFKRRKPQTLQEMCWNVVGIERPRKRGRHLKAATFIIMYGGGNQGVQAHTGLSLRRIKVLRKELLGNADAKILGKSIAISRGKLMQPDQIRRGLKTGEVNVIMSGRNVGKSMMPNIVHAVDSQLSSKINRLAIERGYKVCN